MDMAPEQERFKRVEPDDPHRCQGIAKGNGNQCVFEAIKLPDGTFGKHCTLHDSYGHQLKSYRKEARRLYDLTKYRGKVDRLVEAGEGIFLDEELATLRMTLETCLNRYEELELVTMSGQVSSLVRDIRDTLVANNKLKSQLGALIDKATIDRLCDGIIQVVAGELKSTEALDRVSGGIARCIAEAVSTREGNGA